MGIKPRSARGSADLSLLSVGIIGVNKYGEKSQCQTDCRVQLTLHSVICNSAHKKLIESYSLNYFQLNIKNTQINTIVDILHTISRYVFVISFGLIIHLVSITSFL